MSVQNSKITSTTMIRRLSWTTRSGMTTLPGKIISNLWKFLSTIRFHANCTCLEWPPVWKDHFFLTSKVVVPHRCHCITLFNLELVIHTQNQHACPSNLHEASWIYSGRICNSSLRWWVYYSQPYSALVFHHHISHTSYVLHSTT